MGQAPANGTNSLRTMPRNFPGRSGTQEDSVYLCSPETAAAAALTGTITDPRDLRELYGLEYPQIELPAVSSVNLTMLEKPLPPEEASEVTLVKGENISSLPVFGPLADRIEAPVALVMGNDVSTDEILPAGARVLPYRSNIPKLAEFTFTRIDETYPARAAQTRDTSGHIVVAGANYGQGSSREHAAITPRFLGLRAVVAVSFARIHWQNLANFGVLALEFTNPADHDRIQQGDVLLLTGTRAALVTGTAILVRNETRDEAYAVRHGLSTRQVDMLLAGGLIPWLRERKARASDAYKR
jgi:aconitate hydratase